MMIAAGLNGHSYYIHWGVIQIALANLIVIVLMVLLFAAALIIPMSRSHDSDEDVDEH